MSDAKTLYDEDFFAWSQQQAQALRSTTYLDLFIYTPEQILGDWFPPEPEP